MAQIQVGFGTVFGDEHLAVLERAHGAGIHVDVGIQLEHGDFDAAGFEDGGERSGRDAFAERRNDPARDEDVFGHERSEIMEIGRDEIIP